jgi:hypothetical protein
MEEFFVFDGEVSDMLIFGKYFIIFLSKFSVNLEDHIFYLVILLENNLQSFNLFVQVLFPHRSLCYLCIIGL